MLSAQLSSYNNKNNNNNDNNNNNNNNNNNRLYLERVVTLKKANHGDV